MDIKNVTSEILSDYLTLTGKTPASVSVEEYLLLRKEAVQEITSGIHASTYVEAKVHTDQSIEKQKEEIKEKAPVFPKKKESPSKVTAMPDKKELSKAERMMKLMNVMPG